MGHYSDHYDFETEKHRLSDLASYKEALELLNQSKQKSRHLDGPIDHLYKHLIAHLKVLINEHSRPYDK
jgi:hypothetical protein